MKKSIKPCLEQHLVDKLKKPNAIPAADWLASAAKHLKSAQVIINDDPAGALQMAWSAMHDIAKAAAASAGSRLEAETHGKIVDFLACTFADDLEDRELGLIRSVQGGRNKSSYDDPRVDNSPIVGAAVNLAAKMIKIANASLTPPHVAERADDGGPA